MFLQQLSPTRILSQRIRIADYDQGMLCPRDCNVDAVILFDELTGSSPHHGNKHYVEFAAL